jgi:hypothetical protein
MKKNRLIVLIFVLILAILAMTACGGGGGGGGGNGSGGNNAAPVSKDSEDPCPCCPECIQKECECAECGERADCKCKMPPGGGGSITYDVVIDMAFLCPIHADSADPGIVSKGTARVTMNFIDSKTGYQGSSSDGAGEMIANHMCDLDPTYYIPGELGSYEFTAQLSVPGDHQNILVGLDRLGPDELFYHYSVAEGLKDQYSQSAFAFFFQEMMGGHFVPPDDGLLVYPDPEAGLLIFEVPYVEGEDMQGQQFVWSDEGRESIIITITLTPVP